MANPFKDLKLLQRNVTGFLKRHRATIYQHSKRISDYFEMSCFNYLVRYYENQGYHTTISNLRKNKFRYKCSTMGDPNNFSYFSVGKNGEVFEIHHNINIASAHHEGIFTTPDISVILPDSIVDYKSFYRSGVKYYYCPNDCLVTFFESKNFNPFPELQFSFIGVLNELKPGCLIKIPNPQSEHIAPSLLMSGKANDHNTRIKENLEQRYSINILSDLFMVGNARFSKYSSNKFQRITYSIPVGKTMPFHQEMALVKKVEELKDFPF